MEIAFAPQWNAVVIEKARLLAVTKNIGYSYEIQCDFLLQNELTSLRVNLDNGKLVKQRIHKRIKHTLRSTLIVQNSLFLIEFLHKIMTTLLTKELKYCWNFTKIN